MSVLNFGLVERLARVRRDNDRLRRNKLTLVLEGMDISPTSEVGKHVLEGFTPVWSSDIEVNDMYNETTVFEYLTLLVNDGDDDDK